MLMLGVSITALTLAMSQISTKVSARISPLNLPEMDNDLAASLHDSTIASLSIVMWEEEAMDPE